MSEYDSSFDSGRESYFCDGVNIRLMGIGGILVGVLAIVGGVLR
jgi:hypothetical protein